MSYRYDIISPIFPEMEVIPEEELSPFPFGCPLQLFLSFFAFSSFVSDYTFLEITLDLLRL